MILENDLSSIMYKFNCKFFSIFHYNRFSVFTDYSNLSKRTFGVPFLYITQSSITNYNITVVEHHNYIINKIIIYRDMWIITF